MKNMGVSISFKGTVDSEKEVNEIILDARAIAENCSVRHSVVAQDGYVYKSRIKSMHEGRSDKEFRKRVRSLEKNNENYEVKITTPFDIFDYWAGTPFLRENVKKFKPGRAVILSAWSWAFMSKDEAETRKGKDSSPFWIEELLASGEAYPSAERGIILHPSPCAESLNLLFHRLGDGCWEIRDFMKTQPFEQGELLPNLGAHIFSVNLLVFLKNKHIPSLEIHDEGDYHFTEKERKENIRRWKRELRNLESSYHQIATRWLDYWETVKPQDPRNIVLAYGETIQTMKKIAGLLDRLLEGSNLKVKRGTYLSAPTPKQMESITTTYRRDKATDTLAKGEEVVARVERPRVIKPISSSRQERKND